MPKFMDIDIWPPVLQQEWETEEEAIIKHIGGETPPSQEMIDRYQWSVMLQKDYDEWIKKYWTASWYDWSIQNRWCKRDVNEAAIDITQYDISIQFETPRSPPEAWFAKLCETFPDITMSLNYEEPGVGFEWDLMSDGYWWYSEDHRDYVPVCQYCTEKEPGTQFNEWYEDDICGECLVDVIIETKWFEFIDKQFLQDLIENERDSIDDIWDQEELIKYLKKRQEDWE